MKQEIKTIELKGTRSKQLCILRIARTSTGVKIYFKSKSLHDLFKGFSGEMLRYRNWQSQTMDGRKLSSYDIGMFSSDMAFMGIGDTDRAGVNISETMQTALGGWGTDTLIHNPNYNSERGIPNISFITSDRGDRGISVEFQIPMSNNAINLYATLAEEYIKFLYENFCGGQEIEVVMRGKLDNKWRRMSNGKYVLEEAQKVGVWDDTFTGIESLSTSEGYDIDYDHNSEIREADE